MALEDKDLLLAAMPAKGWQWGPNGGNEKVLFSGCLVVLLFTNFHFSASDFRRFHFQQFSSNFFYSVGSAAETD